MKGFQSETSNLPLIEDQSIDVKNLWRSNICHLDGINNLKIDSRVVWNLITKSGNKLNLLGTVKWLGQINTINCVGIELDESYIHGNSGKLDARNKFAAKPKHGIFTPISNTSLVSNYTAATVPGHLKTSKDIDLQSRVTFAWNLSNLDKKCVGTVVWSGRDENNYYFGVKLDSPVADGTDGTFSYQRLFVCHNNCGLLVPVQKVEKYSSDVGTVETSKIHEKYQMIIKMLMSSNGDVNVVNENNETVFDIARTIDDRSALESLLSSCEENIDLSQTQSMQLILMELVDRGNWVLLRHIIDEAIVDDISNKYLLLLSISILKQGNQFDLYNTIVSICPDKNAILSNGETFLTALLKSNVNKGEMVRVIKQQLFDINKPNTKKESPLIVACELLLVDIVKLLINLNCDVKFNGNKAIEVAVLAKSRASVENICKISDGQKIINMLSQISDTKDMNLCQICMDNSKNVALNCGHVICSVCEAKLVQCPFCSSQISNRLKIYL